MDQPAASPESLRQAAFRDRLRGYWRRRGSFFGVFSLGLAATIALALLLPPTYMSSATILIEQQEIPQEFVRSAVTSFADQRVQMISQRVMTTTNLLPLIDRYSLYPDIRVSKPREVLMQSMRSDIAMRMISADVIDPRSGRPTQATIAFGVSYKSHSPDLAYKVANDLTSLYLNENLTSRSKMAEQTASFFADEANRQLQRIKELDQKLSDFKQKNHDRLPELTQINMEERQRLDLDLRDADNRLAAIDSQRVLLEAQLAQIKPIMQVYSDDGRRVMDTEDRLKALKSQLAGYKARYAPGHPDIVNTEREVAGLEKAVSADDNTSDLARELQEATSLLASAREKYTAEHPDVIRLSHRVDDLQKQIAAAPPSAVKAKEREHADNPAYIQVKGQLDALSVDRETAVRKHDDLRAKLDEYERRLAQTPAVEREYREMLRDLDSTQQKYQEIRSKQTEVQVSENLESQHKGERFTLIEPPLPPEKPISPNRFLVLALGTVLSLGLGVAVLAVRENLDRSVRSVRDVRALLNVPPLVAIPLIVTRADRRRRRLKLALAWNGAILGLLGGALALHFLVLPLDVFWAGLLRRFGV